MLINLIINKLPPRKSQTETVRGRCDGRRNLVFRAEARKINSDGRGPKGVDSKDQPWGATGLIGTLRQLVRRGRDVEATINKKNPRQKRRGEKN